MWCVCVGVCGCPFSLYDIDVGERCTDGYCMRLYVVGERGCLLVAERGYLLVAEKGYLLDDGYGMVWYVFGDRFFLRDGFILGDGFCLGRWVCFGRGGGFLDGLILFWDD